MATLVFNGLVPFARFCEEQGLAQAVVLEDTASVAAKVMQSSIKGVFGDKKKLAALQQSTIDLRGGTDDPLLVDGKLLRDSIEEKSESMGPTLAVAGVGSSESLLLSHEHGYVTAEGSMIPGQVVPPRPAFAIGVKKGMPKVQAVVRLLMGPRRKARSVVAAERLAAIGLVTATR